MNRERLSATSFVLAFKSDWTASIAAGRVLVHRFARKEVIFTLIDENTSVRCDGRICYNDKDNELQKSSINTRTAPRVSYPPTFRLSDHWRGSSRTGTSSIFDGYDIEPTSDVDSHSFLDGRLCAMGKVLCWIPRLFADLLRGVCGVRGIATDMVEDQGIWGTSF